jgi:hypothetical protein
MLGSSIATLVEIAGRGVMWGEDFYTTEARLKHMIPKIQTFFTFHAILVIAIVVMDKLRRVIDFFAIIDLLLLIQP